MLEQIAIVESIADCHHAICADRPKKGSLCAALSLGRQDVNPQRKIGKGVARVAVRISGNDMNFEEDGQHAQAVHNPIKQPTILRERAVEIDDRRGKSQRLCAGDGNFDHCLRRTRTTVTAQSAYAITCRATEPIRKRSNSVWPRWPTTM